MEDIARQAGVSRAAVSIAYRGLDKVSEETRAHIFAVGRALGYQPNRIAAQLASKQSNSLGVFLLDLHNDLFADIYDGIREVAAANGKRLVLAAGATDGSLDQDGIAALLQSRVDAIIATNLLLPDMAVKRFLGAAPFISVARDVQGADSVLADNELGSRLVVDHLVHLGHRRIAMLANPQTDGYRGRQEGYEAAMRHYGLSPRIVPSSYSREVCAADTVRVLDSQDRPTAIFAHDDQAALGVLDAITVRGLRPPEISVVGFDNSSLSRAPGVALTTLDVHSIEAGRIAATLAIERLAHPDRAPVTRMLKPTLIIRGTTGPAHQ
jgi:DNA-binding LacI/PurR family transcriptional regulator